MQKTDHGPGLKTTSVDALVQHLCPSWNVVAPRSSEDWFDEIGNTFGATGYMRSDGETLVEFTPQDIKIKNRAKVCRKSALNDVKDWALVEFGKDNRIDEKCFGELEALVGVTGVTMRRVMAEAGLKFCGTIIQGFLRVSLKSEICSQEVCIVPEDVVWETYYDRTFGSMWESPDGLPE
ncbi:MAG: hypothetical protein IPO13_00905 [Rhodocyclaceae bacterium]|nr:hypothetical protein [Rhodocyclaceae bacterium]